jgi:hypothetical protein
MPRVEEKEKSLRERRVEDEDRRLMNEVRDLSLRQVGVGPAEARSTHRRREDDRLQAMAPRSHREGSRDSSRSAEGRERRRHASSDGERRRRRDDTTTTRTTTVPAPASVLASAPAPAPAPAPTSTEEARRRSQEDLRRRHEQTNRTAARQIEHQASLRSLISSSDVDAQEMEEEILRQIQEEGLLDGIDLDHIDISRDQISERIVEGFRRRQRESSRLDVASSNDVRRATRSGQSESREHSGSEGLRPSSGRRTHARSHSATSQTDEQSRSTSAQSSSNLEVQSADESRRRRRTTSGGRSATAPVSARSTEPTRPAARSQTDLSDRRRRPSQSQSGRPQAPVQSRSTPETASPSSVETPAELPAAEEPQSSVSSAARPGTATQTDRPKAPTELPGGTGRSARPDPIFVSKSAPSAASQPSTGASLMPAPLSPRHQRRASSSERATLIQSAIRPTSSSSTGSRVHSPRFPEPSLTCARCAKPHIEYELHYNCAKCEDGDWNICLSCYRAGRGCLHWFGFGYTAWTKWEKMKSLGESPASAERPHMLTANRYLPPKVSPGGADGRRTITSEDPHKRLQSGAFCANCSAWANECYWRCDACNEGDWGFCNNCVNQGKCCTHSLLPLLYKPDQDATPISPTHDQQTPSAATLLTGPGVIEYGSFKPLTFRVSCDICHHIIQPTSPRYHCFSCKSKTSGCQIGDYDICNKCYLALEYKKRISPENGHNGWRRCLQGHRTIVVGFEDNDGGQRRVIAQDLVGGRGLHEEPSKSLDHSGQDLQQWSWRQGTQVRLVTTDVVASAPTTSTSLSLTTNFPPSGGSGMKAVAGWSWYPEEGKDDELLFPKNAEVKECLDVNGDWFWGVYMGAKGLFPAPYVRVLDKGPPI